MKSIKIAFSFLLMTLFLVSCEDESKLRYEVGGPVQPGAFVTAVVTTSVIDGNDIGAGTYEFTLDAPSGNVESYSMEVRYVGVNGSNSDFVPLLTVTEFPTDVVISTSDLASALGVTVGDFNLGDAFNFIGTSVGTDGQVVEFQDLDQDIASENGQLQAYRLNTSIICPLPTGLYEGDYNITTSVDGCFGAIFLDQQVTLDNSDGSVFQRTFTANYLEQFGIGQPDMTFTINFLCGSVTGAENMSTGLGCGGGSLLLSASAMPGPYSETDDSTLVINTLENCAGCGGPADGEVQLTLTRI